MNGEVWVRFVGFGAGEDFSREGAAEFPLARQRSAPCELGARATTIIHHFTARRIASLREIGAASSPLRPRSIRHLYLAATETGTPGGEAITVPSCSCHVRLQPSRAQDAAPAASTQRRNSPRRSGRATRGDLNSLTFRSSKKLCPLAFAGRGFAFLKNSESELKFSCNAWEFLFILPDQVPKEFMENMKECQAMACLASKH